LTPGKKHDSKLSGLTQKLYVMLSETQCNEASSEILRFSQNDRISPGRRGGQKPGFLVRRRATASRNGQHFDTSASRACFGIENTAMSDNEMPFP